MVNHLVGSGKTPDRKMPKKSKTARKIPPPAGNPLPDMSVSSKSNRKAMEEERMYRAKDALNTLTRADEIRRDKALMRDVQKHAAKQKQTIDQVLGGSVTRRK